MIVENNDTPKSNERSLEDLIDHPLRAIVNAIRPEAKQPKSVKMYQTELKIKVWRSLNP